MSSATSYYSVVQDVPNGKRKFSGGRYYSDSADDTDLEEVNPDQRYFLGHYDITDFDVPIGSIISMFVRHDGNRRDAREGYTVVRKRNEKGLYECINVVDGQRIYMDHRCVVAAIIDGRRYRAKKRSLHRY